MTIERPQPVVTGINPKGELLWSQIEMPLWQRLMFPIRYCGDFAAFWQKRRMVVMLGWEIDDQIPNADFKMRKFGKVKKERLNTGD